MTVEQQQAILAAAEHLIVATDALREHDAETVHQYQHRPVICPRTGRVQHAFHPQPEKRRERRKELIAYRKKHERKVAEAIRAACTKPTQQEVQAEKFGTA